METNRTPGPVRGPVALLTLACAVPLGPSLRGQENADFPIDIQRSAGGRQKLGLAKANGFADLEREIVFIIDPRDARRDSVAYVPAEPGLLPIEKTDLRALVAPGAGMKVVAHQALKEVLDGFFKLLNREDKAAYKADLLDALRLPVRPSELLVTAEARFGVRPAPAGEDARAAVLECRLELKAFKVKLAADEDVSRIYANLAACELLFQDRATGRVPVGTYPDPVLLAKAAVVDALRNKLAVSFAMNPDLREAIADAAVAESRKKNVLGDSISRVSRS